MKPILLILSLLLLAAAACSSPEPVQTPEPAAVSQAADTPPPPANTDNETATAASENPATAGATAQPQPTPTPEEALEIVRNRQSTPESTQPQPTPVATAPQDSRQNLLPDCKLPENVQESPSPNLNECYNEDLFAEVKQLRTTLIDFSFKAEGQNISLEESFANIQGGQLGYFRNNGDLQTLISHPNHPYNFLIPGIEEGATTYVAPRQEARAKFIPKEYGIEYFLNNPYFEPKDVNSLFPLPLEENNYLKPKTAITPVRFGPNSLRHEIATAVA